MMLYEVPNNTRVVCTIDGMDFEYLFHHIDGMYSYCTDSKGEVVHLAAWTEVEIAGCIGE